MDQSGIAEPGSSQMRPPRRLHHGEAVLREEYNRRYSSMPDLKTADLLDGFVYMSPLDQESFGIRRADLTTWATTYAAHTPFLRRGCHSSVILSGNCEVQPDFQIALDEIARGSSHVNDDGFIEGPPEFVCEVARDSACYRYVVKPGVYARYRVQELLVWRIEDRAIDWHVLHGAAYDLLPVGDDGIARSEFFLGLWLDVEAMIRGDMGSVLRVLQQGIASPDHARFVEQLKDRAAGKS